MKLEELKKQVKEHNEMTDDEFKLKVNEYVEFLLSKKLEMPRVKHFDKERYYQISVKGVTQIITPANIEIILKDRNECFAVLYQRYLEQWDEELIEDEEERRYLYAR